MEEHRRAERVGNEHQYRPNPSWRKWAQVPEHAKIGDIGFFFAAASS